MNGLNFIWGINELLKCVLVIGGIMGYTFCRRKSIQIIAFLLCNGLVYRVLIFNTTQNRLLWSLIGTFVFIMLFFEESYKAKIKAYFIAEVFIGIMDLFLLSILTVAVPEMEKMDVTIIDLALDVFWLVLLMVLYKFRKNVYEYFIDLSFGWILFLVLLIFGMGMLAGSTQYILNEGVPYSAKKIFLLVQSIVTVLVVVGGVIFSYNIVSRKNMKLLLEKEREKYQLETKFYENKFKQNEELRSFRHDMAKHMKVIRRLCDNISIEDSNVEELKSYVEHYIEKIPNPIRVQTGHVVSDCFITELFTEISRNSECRCSVIGKIQNRLSISDADFCVLLGNALDNVKNEILKIEGPCQVEIEFITYRERMAIKIVNSKAQGVIKTSPKEGHGYGIANMKKIIDHCEGVMKITENDTEFCVEMMI